MLNRLSPHAKTVLLAMAASSTFLNAQAASSDRPFSAHFSTQETIGFDPSACNGQPFLRGTLVGTGITTHLGKSQISAMDCIFPGPGTFTFNSGKLTITAANGDTVTADYSGMLLLLSGPSIYSISGSYRVTGGTGRFEGATGSGSLGGTVNIVTGESEYTASGVIGY